MKHPVKKALALAILGLAALATEPALADNSSLSVINWWTAGSEAKAMNVLVQMMKAQGVTIKNDAIAGGGGAQARTILKTRLMEGEIPGAAQIKGVEIQQWGKTGLLANVDAAAKTDDWDKNIPTEIDNYMKYKGNYVAAPMDLHRLNWLWYNRAVLAKAGIKEAPQTWDELVADLAKIKAKGIIPMAGGGNGWMIATEFDPIALETGGPAWYRDVFVKLDPKAIDSPTMVKALERLRQIEAYTPKSLAGRTWNYDTGLVAHGQAAFQIMGDWANGQFEFLGVEPGGPKVGCVAFPGTASDFIYNVDSFIFFRQHTAAAREATIKLAETMTSPKFQLLFNKYKGSIPDLMNVSLKGYNPCQLKSRAQFLTASKEHNLVPSFSQDMSTYGPPTGAFTDSLDHFYTTNESPQAAAAAMAKRVEVAKSQD